MGHSHFPKEVCIAWTISTITCIWKHLSHNPDNSFWNEGTPAIEFDRKYSKIHQNYWYMYKISWKHFFSLTFVVKWAVGESQKLDYTYVEGSFFMDKMPHYNLEPYYNLGKLPKKVCYFFLVTVSDDFETWITYVNMKVDIEIKLIIILRYQHVNLEKTWQTQS